MTAVLAITESKHETVCIPLRHLREADEDTLIRHSRSNLTQNFLSKMGLAWASRVAVGASLGLSLLAIASAQTIAPLYGTSGGQVVAFPDNAAVAPLNLRSLPGWVVTAACTAYGNPFGLEVAVWEDTGSALVQKGSYFDSSSICGSVSVASLSNTSTLGYTTIVTAVGSLLMVGALQVTAWQVSSSGSISPLGTPAVDNTVSPDWVSVTPLVAGSTRVVTAVDNLINYELKVTAWQVPSTGDIKALGSMYKPNVTGYGSITPLNSSQVVTADQNENASGDLEVISWGIDSAGKVTQQGMVTAGYAWNPVITPYFLASNPSVVTAFVEGSGHLELITWGVSSKGILTRQATVRTGSITYPAALAFIPGDRLPFAAVLGGNGVLDVEIFHQSGLSLKELTSYQTSGGYWPQNPQGAAGESDHRVVTAAINPNNCDGIGDCELELEVWYFDSSDYTRDEQSAFAQTAQSVCAR